MAPIRIPYRLQTGDPTPKPFLRVSLGANPSVPVPAIVDSGADRSAIPLGLARAVGIPYDPSKPLTSRGAGGTFAQYEASEPVVLESEIGQIRLEKPTLNEYISLVLLGREDFFRSYRVTFDQRLGVMDIEPYPDVKPKTKRQSKHPKTKRR